MATQKEELVLKIKQKIIDIFGPESSLAQAMDDPDFFDKLGDLVSFIYGEIMLSQPRPEPRIPREPVAPKPWVYPYKPERWVKWKTTAAPAWFRQQWTALFGGSAETWKSKGG